MRGWMIKTTTVPGKICMWNCELKIKWSSDQKMFWFVQLGHVIKPHDNEKIALSTCHVKLQTKSYQIKTLSMEFTLHGIYLDEYILGFFSNHRVRFIAYTNGVFTWHQACFIWFGAHKEVTVGLAVRSASSTKKCMTKVWACH